ncbi:MAG TPA: sugar phosphate isomerase/epimerase family protein [bacterium]|nr:sugar phosphate isomerase/epimerase family protein [bacterium]HXK93788.1 sugar phosphate isomerase/epimerase family protein [bacterium]
MSPSQTNKFGPKGLFGSYGAGIGAPLELAVEAPGVECFQLHVPEEKDLTPDWANRVKELIEPRGIQIARFVIGYSGPEGDQYDSPQRVLETVGFGVPDHQKRKARLELTKKYIRFGHEYLGVKDFNAHLGHVDPNNEFFNPMVEAVQECCDLTASWGGHYDVETGPEKFEALHAFMKKVNRPGVFRVNLDLANIVLYHGEWEPITFLRKLLDAGLEIGGVHLKDAIPTTCKPSLQQWNGEEVHPGQGMVNFPLLLKTLFESGYRDAIVVEREVLGENGLQKVRRMAETLTWVYNLCRDIERAFAA